MANPVNGGGVARWGLDDISWGQFDRARLDPDIVRIVKAAALVEYNGGAYAHHLCRVFGNDPEFQASARRWGEDEVRHGRALGRWAELADPDFDFAAAFARFRSGFQVDFDRAISRRGSRSGEMVARCIVESATSSYYQALRDVTEEPVLKQICHNIAVDEVRHYKLFYRTLGRYLQTEPIGVWRRLRVAVGRLVEGEDDELACAYHAANSAAEPYDRRRHGRAYARRAFAVYREPHTARAVRLILRAIGLAPNTLFARVVTRLAWAALHHRAARLARLPPDDMQSGVGRRH